MPTTIAQRPKTKEIYDKLCTVIPGGVNSPVRSCKSMQQMPMVAERAHGAHIWDADGHKYIDFCGSWGALIHGHSHPVILDAIQKRMSMGTSFGITTSIEGALARKIVSLVPSVEKIRFVSSGTEATMSAVRLARGYTKRELIIKFNGNYHGHADFFLVQAGSGVFNLSSTSSSSGIPNDIVKHTLSLPYNDLEAFKAAIHKYKDQIAAVIIEPIAGNIGVVPASREFINLLRQKTAEIGAVLIFDEVITGFRIGLDGAQGFFGITPDLTCFGKIMGGGFPAAAFGGKREIMDCLAPLGSVYQAGTLSGNPVAMEAGLQALTLVETPGFYQELENKTLHLTRPLKECLQKHDIPGCVQHIGSMFTLFLGKNAVHSMEDAQQLDFDRYARLFRFMFEHGVYIPPAAQEAWFVSAAHTEADLIKARDLIIEFLTKSN